MGNQAIKTLIVDDSKFIRKAVKKIFTDLGNIEVVGEAENGRDALELVDRLSPDVIVLDVNMPVMDGLTTLKHMMIQHPTPTVMLSSLTKEGALVTFDSLKYGAVDFIAKPSALEEMDLETQAEEIAGKVRASAEVMVDSLKLIRLASRNKSAQEDEQPRPEKIIAIGAAEGGYGTLLKIIPQLPADLPVAYIIVLHVATTHVDEFAEYLDKCSAVRVKRAMENEPLMGRVCYLCSGEEYVTIREWDGELFLHVSSAPFQTRRGSIDMLMFSVAEMVGKDSVGVILSGEGEDGVEGVCEILATGGAVIVQNPQNSLYKKMPNAALKRCAVDYVVSDSNIASALIMCCN